MNVMAKEARALKSESRRLFAEAVDSLHANGTGDVVFGGAIGRIDLPGGDAEAMGSTLRAFADLPDVPIYPGHGPGSRVGHELRTNPFL
ncbi:hypothetical protein DN540_37445 [Burkholderia multivorans]|nr:hypothetical protein DN540_37445 [Burkholderia multivorans]